MYDYFTRQYETAKKKHDTLIEDVKFEENIFNLLTFIISAAVGIAALYFFPLLVLIPVAYITYTMYENRPIKKSPVFKTFEKDFHKFKTNQIYKHMLANHLADLKHNASIKTKTLKNIDKDVLRLKQKITKLEKARVKFSFIFTSKSSQIDDLKKKIDHTQDFTKPNLEKLIEGYKSQITKTQLEILRVQDEIMRLDKKFDENSSRQERQFLSNKTVSTFGGDLIASKKQKEFTRKAIKEAEATINKIVLKKQKKLAKVPKIESVAQEQPKNILLISKTGDPIRIRPQRHS
jgi:hypothetical protein